MSWMSPLTVPITIVPMRSAPVSASSGRRISMPAFIAFAAEQHLGHEQDAVAEVDADDAHALDERLVQHAVGRPSARQQDVRALDDLVGEPVVEVVVHLLVELLVGTARRDRALRRSCSFSPSHQALRAVRPWGPNSGSAATVAAMPLAEVLDLDRRALVRRGRPAGSRRRSPGRSSSRRPRTSRSSRPGRRARSAPCPSRRVAGRRTSCTRAAAPVRRRRGSLRAPRAPGTPCPSAPRTPARPRAGRARC